MDFKPSNWRGRPFNKWIKPRTKYPAKNPATIPPMNPAPVSFAIIPPTNPAIKPGRPEIEDAIYAVKTGTINPNATPPICFSIAANWLYVS